MAKLILLNKPFQVLSQFTDPEGRRCLGDFVTVKGVYPAGRLDWDSEGLMLLTDDGGLQARISHPRHHMEKTYLVQVEGIPSREAIQQLIKGVNLKDGPAKAIQAERIDAPDLWHRDPPVRHRASIPDCWLKLVIAEGRNRQVRRMTAAIGHPTLRLVRYSVGPWSLDGLSPGEWRQETVNLPRATGRQRPDRAGGPQPRRPRRPR